jgi:hypothetical protein
VSDKFHILINRLQQLKYGMERKKKLGMSNIKSVSPNFTVGVSHISIKLLRGYTKLSENIIQIQLITESEAS